MTPAHHRPSAPPLAPLPCPGQPAQLEVRELSRRFGGVEALASVSLSLQAGEIHGLIGPNGAGKTTLFDVITGFCQPDHGTVLLNGQPLPLGRPERIARHGLARTFQNLRVFRELSVLENVLVGTHRHGRAGVLASLCGHAGGRTEEQALLQRARDCLAYVGLAGRAGDVAHSLSYGDQRRLEIARALAVGPALLALDEPAAGMNPSETRALRTLIERIRGDGVTVLLIEHDMPLVRQVCDRISVLDAGRLIAQGTPAEVVRHPQVIEAYLGRSHAAHA